MASDFFWHSRDYDPYSRVINHASCAAKSDQISGRRGCENGEYDDYGDVVEIDDEEAGNVGRLYGTC
jgi:hypothetical protein